MRTILIANRKGGCGKTLIAVTLATALAARGERVALADADPQKSSLRWLKRRPDEAAPIRGIDWTSPKSLGEAPKKTAWLVVDAPGALDGGDAKPLIGEADAVLVPVLASVFDVDSAGRFLAEIEALKRVRKGRAVVELVANRLRPRARATARLDAFFAGLGQAPLARLSERAIYGELAERGLGLFDRPLARTAAARAEWAPILHALQ